MKNINKLKKVAGGLFLMMVSMTSARSGVVKQPDTATDFVHDECVFDTLYPTFRYLYETITRIEKAGPTEVQRRWGSRYLFSIPLDWYINPTVINTGGGFPWSGEWDVGRAQDSVRVVMRRVCEEQMSRPGFSVEAEKARLLRQIETFGDTAQALPLVYVTIAKEYAGNVGEYVDDLFARSMATNAERIRHFVKNPAIKRMQRDPGFLLAVSKLMYRLWEAQGRPPQPASDGTRLVILRSELEKR